MNLQTNPQLELAFEYVRNTDKNVFLTGKAGSGKTTFLHQIKADGRKRMAVVAPTGVAAINAGGMTIHSLFQLGMVKERRHDRFSVLFLKRKSRHFWQFRELPGTVPKNKTRFFQQASFNFRWAFTCQALSAMRRIMNAASRAEKPG